MESDRIVTAHRWRGRKGDYDVRRASPVEWKCDYNSRTPPNGSKTRSIRVCAGQLPVRTGPVYSTSVRFLASTTSSLPQYSPSASPFLDSPPRHLIGHGGGIRIVISNRATTHEPLPCRSKFVNGLRIPGLPAGSH